jgi:hypothetical protein
MKFKNIIDIIKKDIKMVEVSKKRSIKEKMSGFFNSTLMPS